MQASLVLLDPSSGEVLWQNDFESDRLHNAKIFDPVAQALEICRGKLAQIVVGLGPGSYSGIRVGIAVANGLGLALGVPVAGLASIAILSDEEEFFVTGDARRSSYYLAHIKNRRLQAEPTLMNEEAWQEQMAVLAGKNLSVYSTEKKMLETHDEAIQLAHPNAADLAREVAAMEDGEWAKLSNHPLQPIYLRAPYITQPKKAV